MRQAQRIYLCGMTHEEIVRIENEIYTKIVIDELQKQKVAGKAITEYVLDKYEIDRLTVERIKVFMKGNG